MKIMNKRYKNEPALTYDDVQLVPMFSHIATRADIDLTTAISKNWTLDIPYVATCMDTVCESEMAIEMARYGGAGCIHRFMSIEDQCEQVAKVSMFINNSLLNLPVMAAVGANGDNVERAFDLAESGADIILIDVAHGHHQNVRDSLSEIKRLLGDNVDVIAGSIATKEAAADLCHWGADGIRVGIGGGSLCTTRIQTGHGVPSITSIQECASVAEQFGVPVMTDGGIRSSGDIAKAIAAGADNVMLGRLLAGTEEAPGITVEHTSPSGVALMKKYRGSASLETKATHGISTRNVEGESAFVPFQGPVKYMIEKLNDGLRSALSYSGAENIADFQRKSRWNVVTNAGIAEAHPHGLV